MHKPLLIFSIQVDHFSAVLTLEFQNGCVDRAIFDTICYTSVHGHRTTFEKIPVTRRAAFNEYTLRIAKDYEDEFYNSWKSYRAENPAETAERNPGGDSDVERLINALDGSDDEPDGAAAAAAAAVPASDDGAAGAAVRE